jgi:tetratricopeptide (TPR) repeat protein
MAGPLMQIAILVILGSLAYSNTLHAPFNFDDGNFLDNKGINNFLRIASWRDSRYFGSMTLALDYSLHGESVVGYHLVNLLIHLFSAILLYLLLRAILKTPWFDNDHAKQYAGNPSDYLPLFSSLLFVTHPIQTQAVTYIVQRYASLATMLCLASVYFYVLARLALISGNKNKAAGFGFISLLAALLAVKTKEIAFVLPILLLITEFSFFVGNMRKRLLAILPFMALAVIIPLGYLSFRGYSGGGLALIDETARAQSVIPRSDYLFTQFRVIITYLRLIILPVNQNLDYSYPVYQTFFTPPVLLSFLILLFIFGAALYLFKKSLHADLLYRLLAFGVFWFFVALAVESSIIPIVDVIFEHRVYFPSVGVAIFFGTLFWMIWQKSGRYSIIFVSGFAIVVLLLSGATYARNQLWRDPVTLWRDVTIKAPKNYRGWYNLGAAYLGKNLPDKAIAPLLKAIELNPGHRDIWETIGNTIQKTGLFYGRYRRIPLETLKGGDATAQKAWFANSYNNLGLAYAFQGNMKEGMSYFRKSLSVDNSLSEARYNLILALVSAGDKRQASVEFGILEGMDKTTATRLVKELKRANVRLAD